MIGIVIASHGELAQGIKMSAEMIVGHQEYMQVCTLMPSQGPEDIYNQVQEAIQTFPEQTDVLFLVDLWGGTPFNQIQKIVQEHENYALVTGMNLGMVIEACMTRMNQNSARNLMEHLVREGKQSIQSVPEGCQQQKEKKTIIKGIKKGHMEYVLARIDSRLLHGQVATGWTKTYNPDRIIIVSDQVAHDEVRKKMIRQAAPAGVKAHIVPLKKMAELDQDDRFGNTKVILLFENVQDVVRLIDMGVSLPVINLGMIAHTPGKINVNTAISMDLKDVASFEELIKKNVEIDVRKVPSDMPDHIERLLSKAKSTLKEDK